MFVFMQKRDKTEVNKVQNYTEHILKVSAFGDS